MISGALLEKEIVETRFLLVVPEGVKIILAPKNKIAST
jgi:hypothetical protein